LWAVISSRRGGEGAVVADGGGAQLRNAGRRARHACNRDSSGRAVERHTQG
jgi:hypothetical protein